MGNQLKKSPTRESSFSNMLGIFNIDLGGKGRGGGKKNSHCSGVPSGKVNYLEVWKSKST